MKAFDLRHKWGEPTYQGARMLRTCSACGRTDEMELLVPNVVLHDIIRIFGQPNPYRAILAGLPR